MWAAHFRMILCAAHNTQNCQSWILFLLFWKMKIHILCYVTANQWKEILDTTHKSGISLSSIITNQMSQCIWGFWDSCIYTGSRDITFLGFLHLLGHYFQHWRHQTFWNLSSFSTNLSLAINLYILQKVIWIFWNKTHDLNEQLWPKKIFNVMAS